MIPSGPASAHCDEPGHFPPRDQYNNGGIALDDTGMRLAPHSLDCEIFLFVTDRTPNIWCATQVPNNPNDWVFGYVVNGGTRGWMREHSLDVWDGDRWVARCFDSGLVHITQNPT